ncbi:hypothetical protein POM88_013451 [Heracleum sosnowskyi]|uniref:Uncharacterized protein n=1 Tax=Heracleum sosnowskyi TaxID=360622 RepID=A0AAD8MY46_9APIA|nr:hypothetical protein POM88_013451 [Heracleum sosnowskyi]
MYGDRTTKNPNWKLGEMQEEYKRVLKVNICEVKYCMVRQKALSVVSDVIVEHYAKLRSYIFLKRVLYWAGSKIYKNPNCIIDPLRSSFLRSAPATGNLITEELSWNNLSISCPEHAISLLPQACWHLQVVV